MIHDVAEPQPETISIANANTIESDSLLHDNFPVCSWICKSGAHGIWFYEYPDKYAYKFFIEIDKHKIA